MQYYNTRKELEGKEITVAQLLELEGKDTKFYRLTNSDETHRGFQYQDGLNVDHESFNPTEQCQPGGLYFFSHCQIIHWHLYTSCMMYIREIDFSQIPTARIYVEGGKYKADCLFLLERQLWIPSVFFDQYVIDDRHVLGNSAGLKYVEEQTEDMCMAAVQLYNFSLRHIRVQTPKICRAYISRSASNLQHVRKQTVELCKLAVGKNYSVFRFVTNQTPELCMMAVKHDGSMIRFVKEQTPELCKFVVERNGSHLGYIKKQTDELCMLAVKQNGLNLKYVHDQTPEICMAAVTQNGRALYYVKEQTPEICEAAINSTASSLDFVDALTVEMVRLAARRGYVPDDAMKFASSSCAASEA